MIARYAAIEILYLKQGSAVYAELQNRVTSLYCEILAFLANSVKYFNEATAGELLYGQNMPELNP